MGALLPRDLRDLKYAGTDLTPRQLRCLKKMAMGYTYPETAEALNISRDTVKMHLAIARSRLGAKTTPHAVAIAVSLDLI